MADQWIDNGDGTARYYGVSQWPMSREDQKRAGLIATLNRSIHPYRQANQRNARKHVRREEGPVAEGA